MLGGRLFRIDKSYARFFFSDNPNKPTKPDASVTRLEGSGAPTGGGFPVPPPELGAAKLKTAESVCPSGKEEGKSRRKVVLNRLLRTAARTRSCCRRDGYTVDEAANLQTRFR